MKLQAQSRDLLAVNLYKEESVRFAVLGYFVPRRPSISSYLSRQHIGLVSNFSFLWFSRLVLALNCCFLFSTG